MNVCSDHICRDIDNIRNNNKIYIEDFKINDAIFALVYIIYSRQIAVEHRDAAKENVCCEKSFVN